jgi:hypothetical protein
MFGPSKVEEEGLTVARAQTLHSEPGSPEIEIIFSLDDGYVWASWPGSQAGAVRLGTYEAVKSSMIDFFRQCALGERLADRRDNPE